jgi:hypothetical protein
MMSDPRLYSESLFVARGLENWNWDFRSCRRIVVEKESQENWNTGVYNEVQQRE